MKYLYNGIELPALPEWDKTAYPYAYIWTIPSLFPNVPPDYYKLTILKSPIRYGTVDGKLSMYIEAQTSAMYNCPKTDGEFKAWEYYGETVGSKTVTVEPIWTNHDVISDIDGSMFFAASSPVPVTPLDQTSMFMGWLAGNRMAAMLGKSNTVVTFSPIIMGWFIPAPVIPVTPTITQNLSGTYSYNQGSTADALTIVAEIQDEGTLTYQWYQNGIPIEGATSASYTPLTDTEGSATYYCVVTNTLGDLSATVQSESVTVTITVVAKAPTITQNLSGEYSYEQDSTAEPLTIVAEVSDGGILTYQWYRDGSLIEGATSASYTPPTNDVGSGTYYCIVTNTRGDSTATTQSNSVTVTITVPVVPEEPDVPTTTTMVLYPNVILPDINTVWTDKETYPYAYIYNLNNGGYLLWLSPVVPSCDSDGIVNFNGATLYAYGFFDESVGWEDGGTSVASGSSAVSDFVWASEDICDTTGTAHLSAFTPVSVGDGNVCYKGVWLPNIDTVWTDKTTYPYAVLIETYADGSYTLVYMEHKVIRRLDSTFGFAEGSADAYSCRVFMTEEALIEFCDNLGITLEDAYTYGMKIGEWFVMTDMTAETVVGDIIWTSHDILNADGTTYLESHDPIQYVYDDEWPIEWNSLAVANNPTIQAGELALVKISNLTPTVEDFKNHRLIGSAFEEKVVFQLLASEYDPNTDNTVAIYWDGDNLNSMFYMYSFNQSFSDGDMSVERGLYVTDYSAISPDVSVDFRLAETYNDTLPIEWNSLAVEYMPVEVVLPDGMILTKISNLTPDALAMTGGTLAASVQGEQTPMILAQTLNVDVGSAVIFSDMDKDIQVLVASITSTDPSADFGGVAAPETGIYVNVNSTTEVFINFTFDLTTPPKVFFDSFPIDINIRGDQMGILSALETIPLRDENGGSHGSIMKISNMTPSLDELSNVYNHCFSMVTVDGVTQINETSPDDDYPKPYSSKWDDSGTFVKMDGNSLWVVYEAQTLHITPYDNNTPVTVDVTPGIYLSDGMVFTLSLLLTLMGTASENGTLSDDRMRIFYGTAEDAENALAEYNKISGDSTGLTYEFDQSTLHMTVTDTGNGNGTGVEGNTFVLTSRTLAINDENLMRFYIDGIEQNALQGMTWTTWIDSPYNTFAHPSHPDATLAIDTDERRVKLYNKDGTVIATVSSDPSAVYDYDNTIIQANAVYYLLTQ